MPPETAVLPLKLPGLSMVRPVEELSRSTPREMPSCEDDAARSARCCRCLRKEEEEEEEEEEEGKRPCCEDVDAASRTWRCQSLLCEAAEEEEPKRGDTGPEAATCTAAPSSGKGAACAENQAGRARVMLGG